MPCRPLKSHLGLAAGACLSLYIAITQSKAIAGEQAGYQEMALDGLTMIADGDNPQIILNRLEGYLD